MGTSKGPYNIFCLGARTSRAPLPITAFLYRMEKNNCRWSKPENCPLWGLGNFCKFENGTGGGLGRTRTTPPKSCKGPTWLASISSTMGPKKMRLTWHWGNTYRKLCQGWANLIWPQNKLAPAQCSNILFTGPPHTLLLAYLTLDTPGPYFYFASRSACRVLARIKTLVQN